MKKRRVYIILGTIIALFFLLLFLRAIGSNVSIGEKVAVIDVTGIISRSDATIELIHTYRDDPSIKAIVVRINSPAAVSHPSKKFTAN